MTNIKTSCGFEAEIDEEAISDITFLEDLELLEEGNPVGIIKMVRHIMTEEDKNRLYSLLKNEKGRVPTELVEQQVSEILEQLGSKKA